ncbi:MAG: DUF3943 domain-containing protein, partial [Gemmatimonadetes bacterium]|nr:DUF3943 domain-containing protein [Gemmatimonadota bacterium]
MTLPTSAQTIDLDSARTKYFRSLYYRAPAPNKVQSSVNRLLVGPWAPPVATQQRQEYVFCCDSKKFGVAAAEVIAMEIIPNFFNWHVADDTTAVLSLRSWDHNVRTGFEWDKDNFSTNMFAHPFHGNVYFNAGRSNGYSFWESTAFSFAGSFLWEMFGENNRPSMNDWIATSVGGVTIGEALHRTAKMVRNNRAQGSGRSFREFAAFLIDPMGGFSRAIRGELSKYGANPEDRFPVGGGITLAAGVRAVGEGRLSNSTTATGFVDVRVLYGDPFREFEKPFESFEFSVQYNRKEKAAIGRLSIQGMLWSTQLKRNDKVHHVLSVNSVSDYMENNAFEVGGQNFAITLNSRFNLSENFTLATRVQPMVTILAGVNSEYGQFTGRSYDFGSGFGFRTRGQLLRGGYNHFTLGYAGSYTHTLTGATGQQIIHYVFAEARYPL